MAGVSHLDEIIDYKKKVIDALGSSQTVVGLLLNNPTIDMSSDEAYSVFQNNLFDYNYINETPQQATALIMVEVEVPRVTSSTIKDMTLYLQIVVNKSYMELPKPAFKGIRGNRRDNLTRQIDLLLNDSRGFGIGRLQLQSVLVANVADGYTSHMLTYTIPDFAKDRKLING